MEEGSDFGYFNFIGKDVLCIIVKFIPKGSRCNFICINSKIMNLVLERVFQPWIPVKNYLTFREFNIKSHVVKLIEDTNASGLGLLHAIKHCNYNYFVKWRRNFNLKWQNGIIYYYILIVAVVYENNDDNHIKFLELFKKDKMFNKLYPCFDYYDKYPIIKNTMYMEWLCRSGYYKKFYHNSYIEKCPPTIVEIYLKYFKKDHFDIYHIIHCKNIDLFKFLLKMNHIKLRYPDIVNLCRFEYWEEALNNFKGNKYLDILECIKNKDIKTIEFKIRNINYNFFTDLVE